MYGVHLGLIGKRVVDFLLVIIKLFSLDVTAEALRAKIDRKLAISLHRGQFDPKFQVEEDVPLVAQPYWYNIQPIFHQCGILIKLAKI